MSFVAASGFRLRLSPCVSWSVGIDVRGPLKSSALDGQGVARTEEGVALVDCSE